jgi:hypothetical protein
VSLTDAVRGLLARALDLEPNQRGALFDDLFDSLAGHDELEPLMDTLERRGELEWTPGPEEIERRLRDAEANPESMLDADEVFASVSRRLAELRAAQPRDVPTPARELHTTGIARDLAGAGLGLSPPERCALALAILETIQRA